MSDFTKADFQSDQEVRWCPGCGDYSILSAVQKFLATKERRPEEYVFVSGIGCSSRFPYYMNTYGFHTIHGRAPAVATGVCLTNPELSTWMVTGDGDGLSIGANHLMHVLRRNLNLNILLFNNRIYGLTKGQYSPTSDIGKKTTSTPEGSADHPVNPLLFALGAQASFVARAIDVDAPLLSDVFAEASKHEGCSFIEIYQNCNIFNDKAFIKISDRASREDAQLRLKAGELMLFGKDKKQGIAFEGLKPKVVSLSEGTEKEAERAGVLRFDPTDVQLATALARFEPPEFPTPVGVLYKSHRPTFEQLRRLEKKRKSSPPSPHKTANEALSALYRKGQTWTQT